MRKFAILIVFAVSLIGKNLLYSQTNVSVPLDNDVYYILDLAEARGLCAPLPAVKPYTRAKVLETINEILDLGDDLRITRKKRRNVDAGTWVDGTIHGHRFSALVFPEHAENANWEIGDSRISKLWLQRRDDRVMVYHWDRGLSVAAVGATAEAIVGYLCDGLAEYIYG